jgi:hypothetical protein
MDFYKRFPPIEIMSERNHLWMSMVTRSKDNATLISGNAYCNGFDERVARQQFCKQGPTRNNRESCVYL